MIKRARSNWRTALLVCAKCEKKLGGGFGPSGNMPLSKLLRRGADGKGRKADYGVVPVKCLKLCPKRAVAVVDAARPGEWLVVAAGTPLAEIEARLGLGALAPVAPEPHSVRHAELVSASTPRLGASGEVDPETSSG